MQAVYNKTNNNTGMMNKDKLNTMTNDKVINDAKFMNKYFHNYVYKIS